MSTQNVWGYRGSSLSLRRQFRPVVQAAFVLLLGGMPFTTGCQKIDSCEYRCTAEHNACPVGLGCDITLGYCVAEDYTGTCDAQTHEVTVCKNEPVELELPNEAPSDLQDIDGLPKSAAIENGRLKAQFSKKTVFAFGAPDEERQYWHVDISEDCPVLESTTLADGLCVGDVLSNTLTARGGEGELQFSLLEADRDFTLSEGGVLAGKATLAGQHELRVEVSDERGLNTVRTLKFDVSNECADVRGPLPGSCAGGQYEVELGVVGLAPVEVTDFTPVQRDGADLTAKQAATLLDELGLGVAESAGGYVITATPSRESLGSYLLALKLENPLRVEQRNIGFDVKECGVVQADFSVCEGETFDFDLEGSPGDVWTFYTSGDPLADYVGFVSDRRLRGELAAPALYEVRARVENATDFTDQLVTLKLAVRASSDPACRPAEDAGADAGTFVGETSMAPTAPGVDAATPPVEEDEFGQGCVGRPYEFVVPLDGVSSGTWHAEGLPGGLSIGAEGVITGTPGAPFDGSIDVTGSTASGSVANSFRFSVHAWCSVVFKGVPDGATQTHLYQADRRPDVVTRDLSDDLNGDEEVTHFALSPDHEHVAFSVFDPYTNMTRVVVKRRLPLGVGQSETLVSGNITTSPFSEWVSDLRWGSDRHISLIVRPAVTTPDAGADAGPSTASINQTLYVFDVMKSPPATTATQVLTKATRDARDLVWLDGLPCVTLADFPGIPGSRESVCWKLNDGTSSSGAEVFNKFETYQVRGHAGRFLQAHPFETGSIVLTSWMPNAPSGELLQVIHQATFASPLGDLVGTVRDTGMEIARTGDDTSRDPSVDYAPLGVIDDCTTIDAWRAGGSLACSTGLTDPNEKVTIATPTGGGLSTLTPFNAPGHATSARRIFLDDAFYVYDDLDGELNYVDLAANPPLIQSHNHGQGRRAVALEPLDDSRFVMQGTTALWVGVVSSGTLGLTQVNGTGTPAAFSECESAFGWLGFETWCGGDEISRRFQVAPDDDLGVFQTDGSNLELFSVFSASQLKRVDDIRVSCGEHSYCLTEFQPAR